MKKFGFSIIISLLLNAFFAQTTSNNIVQRAIDAFVQDPEMENASVSFLVRVAGTDSIVASYNPKQSLVPASTMKIVTTATALEELTSFKKFTTKLGFDGYIDSNCVLHGNIYIIGGGDPTLGSKWFNQTGNESDFVFDWVDAIANLGIDSITGGVIGDASYFTDEYVPSTWSWGDMGNYYGAGASGLSVFDNAIELEFKTGKKGDTTELICYEPYTPDLKFDNRVIAYDGKKDLAYVFGAPYDPFRKIEGALPENQESFIVKGAMHDPSFVTAFTLETQLENHGVQIAKGPNTLRKLRLENKIPGKIEVFYQQASPVLSKIVYYTNLFSNNLFAEHLLKHIGVEEYKDGSVFSSTLAVTNFWKNHGVNTTGFYMNDGSGLSRANAVSAEFLVGVLDYMRKSKYFESFYSSLPIAGKTGTLRTIGKRTAIYGNLRAKSGTMTRVKSYAGYVKSARGKTIEFALIVNNFNCSTYEVKKKLEKIMVAIGNS